MTRTSKLARIVARVGSGLCVCLASAQGVDEPWKPAGRETSESMRNGTTAINRPKEPGIYYEANVPDTLDLAERARLGINHFASVISPAKDHEMYFLGSVSSMNHWWSSLMWCQPEAVEAMAMERLMSGSQQGLGLEARMLDMLASNVGPEGIYWVPKYANRPWLGSEEIRPYADIRGQGRMMRAMIAWYRYTGNPEWNRLIDRMVDGMDRRLVVHKGDYAYFPIQGWSRKMTFGSCYIKDRGWKDASEPLNERCGEEESLFERQGDIAGALANWHALTGSKQALRLSGELVRFLITPRFWMNYQGDASRAELAEWQGNFPGYINTLRAILEYAIATNDSQLKKFVCDGYEWSRGVGIGYAGFSAGCCAPAQVLGLAVKLSNSGVGDYWEDVDLYIRNICSEMQFTPADNTSHMKARGPYLNAVIGAFGHTIRKDSWFLCCSSHGNKGLFYAWDATLHCSDGVAKVNLLLNRASPWMDIDSYLPYEGKVVLKNKTAREALVRIPSRVDRVALTCRTGGQIVRQEWDGNYLRIQNLKAGDVVTVEFPLEERMERWTLPPKHRYGILLEGPGAEYSFKLKGNTLMEISPSLLRPIGPGVYEPGTWTYEARKEKYRAIKAPMTKVTRYVANQELWW